MKKQVSLVAKMAITLLLAAIGISYIMQKPPRSEVNNYQKESMAKPAYSRSSGGGFFSDLSSSAAGKNNDDDISLTGKKGRYNEVRIGGHTDQ